MQQLRIKQVDAFTTKPFGGNPAGVITEADSLSIDMMQEISGSMNLSETAYVSMPDGPDALYRVRFFTPESEVDLSGHSMIAVTWALVEEGRVPLSPGVTRVAIETNVGLMPVDIHFTPADLFDRNDFDPERMVDVRTEQAEGVLDRIMILQPVRAWRGSDVPVAEIAAILGIEESEITRTGLPLEIVSTGLDQLMVPIAHKETVLSMHPDLIKLALMNKRYGIHTNHIFSLDAWHDDRVSYARHFAPVVGLWEDPATGTAAAGLGTYLLRHGAITVGSMIMEQGNDADSLARILVEIDDGAAKAGDVRIGGLAATSITRTIEVGRGTVTVV
ncbi:MAG: PhzF family phenazine biosynthesis protein [Candidatus Krumholzibacteriota bacterium]|nr:PhzF family phenazine biosynthesis protein [Candidatus Krumholzibacteriota bacterium]